MSGLSLARPKEPWEKRVLSTVLVTFPCSTADGRAGMSQAQRFPPVCSQPKGGPDLKQNVHKRGESILPGDLRAWLPEV